jgi:hypothetical protein
MPSRRANVLQKGEISTNWDFRKIFKEVEPVLNLEEREVFKLL